MIEYISLTGFVLAVFVFGITVGKLVEKIERFLNENEYDKHRYTHKNDRR